MISLVIPTYNANSFVKGLFSMFRAQRGGELELLFIDDGSTDGTPSLVESESASLPFPVRILRQANAGVSAARNRGLREAAGEYVAFMDVDDLICEDWLETLSGLSRERQFDVLLFDILRLRKRVGRLSPQRGSREPAAITRKGLFEGFLLEPKRFGPVNLLLRRDFIERHALRFPEGAKYYEDYHFILRLFMRAENPLWLHRALYGYVMTPGSAMGTFSAERFLCLSLLGGLDGELRLAVPEAYPSFARWAVPRVFWSVLWQAALAVRDYRTFARLSDLTRARDRMEALAGFPLQQVRAASALYVSCPRLYHRLARLLGRRRSAVRPLGAAQAEEMLLRLGSGGGIGD